ncbi:MAG: septal ring lytic transglycosylase RlpA family protein [Burkholderiales bacterium]|nr:septal ring lytic transglycosylase RlpA family protein [Burkholderiales bacterium]
MTGPVLSAWGALKCGFAASLLVLLAGCTTLPVPSAAPPPGPAPALSSAEPAPLAPAAATPAPPPHKSRLAEFIARRLHRQVEKVETVEAPAPAVEAPAPVDEKYQLTGEAARELERGHASWYGAQFHGRRTASGENYDKYALTAAHKTLPFGTIVRVRSLALGREVDVRINDRGPFSPGRVIDLSQAAAEALGLIGSGGAQVSLNVADSGDDAAPSPGPGKKTGKAAVSRRR